MGFLFCGEQPLNILEVVGLRAPTAVETCHWHVSKSRPSLRMKRALRSGRWDSICCGKQPLNILEVVGLRAPTAVAECHRHSAKSRPSLRMERALRSGRWDSICCGKQPLNILEVVGLRAPTAVETCHWHVSKSRLSNPTFGAKKQQPSEWMAVVLAEKVGFEPTWRVTANSISSRARYDHFDTSPYRACLTGAYLFYHAMTENTSAFSEIVIIFISPERHPADNGLPHSGKA